MGSVVIKTILSEAKDLVPMGPVPMGAVPKGTVQVGARCFASLSIGMMTPMTPRTAHG